MNNQFSAAPQSLGYYYQALYGLLLILDGNEDAKVSIESLDDIVFEENGSPLELLQLKHHAKQASLSDSSTDFWKSIRIWCSNYRQGKIELPQTTLALITTASSPNDSIASFLRPDSARQPKLAYEKMIEIAQTSKNDSLKQAFNEFLSIPEEKRKELVSCIKILDYSPDIAVIPTMIKRKIEFAVRREHLDGLFERLLGWWLTKVIFSLRQAPSIPISKFDVHSKIVDISDQFKPDALPIDFLSAFPPMPLDPTTDDRLFVQQLRTIVVNEKRIEKAMLDYYRAFEQRARWVREDLLIDDDVIEYEKKLVDEWERRALAIKDEISIEDATDEEQRIIGRRVYSWIDQEADIRIRPNVTEEYVLRGSYHLLANENPPRVWWHPKFLERLEQILPKI